MRGIKARVGDVFRGLRRTSEERKVDLEEQM